MFLYRAINNEDYNNLMSGKDIECSLIRRCRNIRDYSSIIYYDLCINKKRSYALDTIAGHIAGKRLYSGLSCWISTTSNFNFAASEYAVPQAGNYNPCKYRKPIAVIEVEGNQVLRDAKYIDVLKERNDIDDIIIDLRNKNLSNLYNKVFLSEAYNRDMPGYDPFKLSYYKEGNKTPNVNGFSNFATNASEVLFYKNIKRGDIKFILYPIMQDILFNYNVDGILEKDKNVLSNIDSVLKRVDTIEGIDMEFFNILYPSLRRGNNLTDYLVNNYEELEGNDIYEKYNNLKERKRELLNKIADKFNETYNCSLKINKLVDDELLVFDYDNPIKISKNQVNDILVISKDDNLYVYDSSEKNYVLGPNTIEKEDIKTLIKKK